MSVTAVMSCSPVFGPATSNSSLLNPLSSSAALMESFTTVEPVLYQRNPMSMEAA